MSNSTTPVTTRLKPAWMRVHPLFVMKKHWLWRSVIWQLGDEQSRKAFIDRQSSLQPSSQHYRSHECLETDRPDMLRNYVWFNSDKETAWEQTDHDVNADEVTEVSGAVTNEGFVDQEEDLEADSVVNGKPMERGGQTFWFWLPSISISILGAH